MTRLAWPVADAHAPSCTVETQRAGSCHILSPRRDAGAAADGQRTEIRARSAERGLRGLVALIFRSIVQIDADADGFLDRAQVYARDWLRRKLDAPDLDLPAQGSTLMAGGTEVSLEAGADATCSVFRVSVFEGKREDQAEVKTTLTALREEEQSWAWIDLERWSPDHGASRWTPVPPGLLVTVLREEHAVCGDLRMQAEPVVASGDEGALVAQLVLDGRRMVPIVVVSYNASETNGEAASLSRGTEIARRVAGVGGVYVLAKGAVTAFSKEMLSAVGEGMDVHSGAVRTYLTGLGSTGDHPGRHRFVAFRKLEGRRPDLAALIVAPPLFRVAVESPPPRVWRSAARALLLGEPDTEQFEELLSGMEEEVVTLQGQSAELQQDLADQVLENTLLQRRNDDLARRLAYFRSRVEQLDSASVAQEPVSDDFDPILSSEALAAARDRLELVELPDHLDEGVEYLDAQGDESWAGRAWSAFQALNNYAQLKQASAFEGSFLTYCKQAAGDFVIPDSWVAPTETKQTLANPEFKKQRTLPVSNDVDASGMMLMPEHIRIEKGGTPSPRIYYYDDTRGATGKIHVGWFGDHLDSWAKS